MQKRTTSLSRFVSYVLTLLLTVGHAPAFAAPGKPTADALAPQVTSLQMQFETELVDTNLTLVGGPKIGTGGDTVSQVAFLATAPMDLSRSGRLVHAKEYYFVSTEHVPVVAATQDVQVDVNLEKQHVDVTTRLGFHEAFNGRDGHPLLQGLAIENVIEIPLEEYRQVVNAAAPQKAFQELSQKLQAQEAQISRTTVILPNGHRTTFRGTEMTLAQGLDRVIRSGDAMTQVSLSCVKRCMERAGVQIGWGGAACLIGVVVVCGASCFIIGPACVACFQAGFLGCNIGVGGITIVALIECLLRCR